MEDKCESSIEPCGQSERLVDRLKDLIKGYGDGLDVFKELIQNADDAGATSMKICLDTRMNNEWKTDLLSPKMVETQGECFWLFNNAKFTENDFENIIKLGRGHKGKKSGVIGKFGLGFNAIYNITDLPSIMSGQKLLMFDPNLMFLPKHLANESNPGVKIKLNSNRAFLNSILHQFKPFYGIFGYIPLIATKCI